MLKKNIIVVQPLLLESWISGVSLSCQRRLQRRSTAGQQGGRSPWTWSFIRKRGDWRAPNTKVALKMSRRRNTVKTTVLLKILRSDRESEKIMKRELNFLKIRPILLRKLKISCLMNLNWNFKRLLKCCMTELRMKLKILNILMISLKTIQKMWKELCNYT